MALRRNLGNYQNSRKAWELQRDSTELPTLEEYFKFLERRCSALEVSSDLQKVNKTISHITYDQNKGCSLCKGNHFIKYCPTFIKYDLNKRRQTVTTHNLCYNCLRSSHSVHQCQSSNCRTCGKKHNTLLHNNNLNHTQRGNGITSTKGAPFRSGAPPSSSCTSHEDSPTTKGQDSSILESNVTLLSEQKQVQTLLCTARVLTKDKFGNLIECRALLDSCSQSNFVTSALVAKLGLTTFSTNSIVSGISSTTKRIQRGVSIPVLSRLNNFERELDFLVLEKITCKLPHVYINTHDWNIPKSINLADPFFFKPSEIDLLIGADVFFEIINNGHYKLNENLPSLHNSEFGWIVSGRAPIKTNSTDTFMSINLLSQINLAESLAKFWRIEEIPGKNAFSQDEKKCEKLFETTTTRNESGRFQVELPLVPNYENQLGNSFNYALKRFKNTEFKFKKNPELFNQYKNFIDEYINLGHAKVIDPNYDPNKQTISYYLPHHAVFKPDSETSKIRVVFDASMCSTSGKSLNDLLLVGPTLQSDLFEIILRFRSHLFVFSADIVKMFRQIEVKEKHQPLQRILWRENPLSHIQIIQLKTVTYGTACAPYLAQKCLMQLAEENAEKFHKASQTLKKDTYMDDVLSGTDSLESLKLLTSELVDVVKQAGFELHKWRSNATLLSSNQDRKFFDSQSQTIKALGLVWNPKKDKFIISIPSSISRTCNSKREILSCISQIFDPLGLITPLTIKAKLFVQRLWSVKVSWDEILDPNLLAEWKQLNEFLGNLPEISVNRSLFRHKNTISVQIHGFCDASQQAYGACVYLRVVYNDGNVSTKLLCSKSRVAPLKTISLPRLELCGALLLSRLITKVQNALTSVIVDNTFLWSDSTIVLSWINSPCNKWNTFVSHRVAEIQELTLNCYWKHVSSNENAADIISRGTNLPEFVSLDSWWSGPSWLLEKQNNWENEHTLFKNLDELPEKKKIVSCVQTTAINSFNITERFSSLTQLIHVVGYCFRFKFNCLNPKNNKYTEIQLSVEELNHATTVIIHLIQSQCFYKEIQQLKKQESIDNKILLPLNLFLDENQILRVGGRIQYADVPYDQRHPILLPAKHHFTNLVVESLHKKLLHAGPQLVISNVRLKYWILGGRREIRRILDKCTVCFRFKAKGLNQIMSSLPKSRLSPTKPFTHVGIDFAGPIQCKQMRLRKALITKAYICLFICMTVKAVHIELVSDLSTESFLLCFKRFISRRGLPSHIYTDNATNFKGANNKLRDIYNLLLSNHAKLRINSYLTENKITWKFNTPLASHFGGLWEANIKGIKHLLIKNVGNLTLTFEELTTLLTQIEAILNSRPICPLSDDVRDLNILTPGHFLIHRPLTAYVEPTIPENIPINRLKYWELCVQIQQNFWRKWHLEYLHNLQQRNKWQLSTNNLKIGTMVLLIEDNLPPLNWKLGRVTCIFPGSDNKVRTVEVTTENGSYLRPITKVSPLPFEGNT